MPTRQRKPYITPIKPTRAIDESGQSKIEDIPTNSVPCYDIAGNLLFQHSMDAGDRWMLKDSVGKPMLAWDVNETPQGTTTHREAKVYATDYDELHRSTAQWLTINSAPRIMVERYEYQDGMLNDSSNLNGQLISHYDSSGRIETIRRDFKGNVQEIRRTLARDATASVMNWNVTDVAALNMLLEQETYVQITQHDALNSMTRLYNWHRPAENRIAVYIPRYNEREASLL